MSETKQTQPTRNAFTSFALKLFTLTIAFLAFQTTKTFADLTLLQATTVDTDALTFANGSQTNFGNIINGRSHQQYPLRTYRGYQYTSFYDDDRQLCVGRRKLPAGAWEVIRFTDYNITSHDSHNVAVLGICENDGTIHLAFDHHRHDLNYRVSIPGVATNPDNITWSTALFGSVTDTLGPLGKITQVTYPRFVSMPNGNLMLYYRYFTSGNGDSMIRVYNGTTGQWQTSHGKFIARNIGTFSWDGDTSNFRYAYINGLSYAGNRLHCSWVWRDLFTGTSADNQHDLCYAYSDDDGVTWNNSAGTQIAVTGTSFINVNSTGLIVSPIDPDTGLANQTTQYAYPDGGLHTILQRHPSTGGPSRVFYHHWRDAAGVWNSEELTFNGSRPELLGDAERNLFVIYMAGDNLRIQKGVPNAGLTAWTWSQIYNDSTPPNDGEGQIDPTRWQDEGTLSIYHQEEPTTILDYGTGTPFDGLPSPLHVTDFQISLLAAEPNPAHEALEVALSPTLEWVAGINATANRVYFGTDATAVANATTASPEFKGHLTGTTYTPAGPLIDGTTYYWRVDSYESSTVTRTGLLWSFTAGTFVPPTITMAIIGSPAVVDDPATWTDGLPAHSNAHYIVPDDGNLRSQTGTSTFPGNSLTVEAGGKFQVRSFESGGETTTVNALILNGGTSYSSGDFTELTAGTGSSETNVLAGTLTNSGYTRLTTYGTGILRSLKISSLIEGSGRIAVRENVASKLSSATIENSSNTFSGTWQVDAGSSLIFAHPDAPGTGDIEVLGGGCLEIQGDWAQDAILTVADASGTEVVVSTYDWALSSLMVGSLSVADGVYTPAELSLLGDTVFSGTGTITVGTPVSSVELIAGWDTWDSTTAPSASVTASGISASATASTSSGNWSISDSGADPGRGSSEDTTWGSFDGDGSAASFVTNVGTANFTVTNGRPSAEVTLTITNNGTSDIELEQFHMDVVAFRPNAPRTYALNVLAGSDITVGNVFTSANLAITHLGGGLSGHDQHDDLDLDLSGLADSTLEAGGTAIIQIAFSDGTGSGGGHHLFLDNVAVSGTLITPLTELQSWRLAHFGTTDNTGNAADSFDANGDGESNLVEFATAQDPHADTSAGTMLIGDLTTLDFTYTRSKAALADGMTFTVEWSDTLLPGSWSDAGVSEMVDTEDSVLQNMIASVPPGSGDQRFYRLAVEP